MLIIPKEPKVLRLSIGRLWNGERCPDSRLSATTEIQAKESGVEILVITPPLPNTCVSESPVGTRLEEIDAFDRLCLFFVEEGGEYLEIKLGISGQYLVSGFDSPRSLVADFSEVDFLITHQTKGKNIINKILVPWDFFPANLKALNVFLVAGNQYLAYHPVSGSEPDFHQPQLFPFAKIAN